jgi:uncharacterized LabA/DUF88 family protein
LLEDRLKIAVFVDFDNIEIGVKNTLNRKFDISAVLEAIKERGEIVTKIAYGDWKRSGDYGRQMGQHAIQMVQRNLTPGGDKNGADINLALDALEMAFTLSHINAFVIVGGDSDFMTLVEKLKQYDKKVIIVGGRGFTSTILQKNCHEFIAYENLIRSSSSGRRQSGGGRSRSTGDAQVSTGDRPVKEAIPMVRRALKVLSDREVSPQLGLLKSTLLQLDSTFSERNYGATTFRHFIEKLAQTGLISLKQVDRSLLVELVDDGAEDEAPAAEVGSEPSTESGVDASARIEEGLVLIRGVFDKAEAPLKWPLYVRGVKQYIKSIEPDFDERAYGFTGLLDALRQSQKAGLFRLERNRQGVLRVYPGDAIIPSPAVATSEPVPAGTSEEAEHLKASAQAAEQATATGVEPAGDEPVGKAKTTKKTTKKKTTKKKTAKKATKKATKKITKKAAEPEPEAGGETESTEESPA